MITKAQVRRRLGLPPTHYIRGKVWRRYLRRRYPRVAVDPALTAISCQYSRPPVTLYELDDFLLPLRKSIIALYERPTSFFSAQHRLTTEERAALMPENRVPSCLTRK